MASQERLQSLVETWLEWDENADTRSEIESLRNDGNWVELEKRLGSHIQFGTAGLRGPMQAGFTAMNLVTVIGASQGIAMYMLDTMEHREPSQLSVLIGHDTRHHSPEFARVAASAFASKGINVLLYEDYVPTPFVSFGVNYFKANVGIMITASHNPKADNGYKVYWSNGCQINTPVDKQIADSIGKNQKPWLNAFRPFAPTARSAQLYLRDEVLGAYISRLKEVCQQRERPQETAELSSKPFLYTPLHGVGSFVMEKIARDVLHTAVHVVPEQKDPDPEFSTVKFPNPEEPGALDAAISAADIVHADIIVANDPDADRLATAERTDHGWHVFTGDQLGVILAYYIIELEQANPSSQRVALLSSAVSSGMLKKLVRSAGPQFHHEETLTGFKWIGNRAKSLTERGFKVVFGYEEALGYMYPLISFDKDGLAAATLYMEAQKHWKRQGITPYSKLVALYDVIGYHESINTYFRSPTPLATRAFFEGLRKTLDQNPSLAEMPFEKWRDVTRGYAYGIFDSPLQDPGSQMITCVVIPEHKMPDSKVTFTLRGSGTEPKLKLYLEASSSAKQIADLQAVQVLKAIISEWVTNFGSGLTYPTKFATSSGRTITID
ncbi:putative phosphoglucomutase [Phaeomoniella chlamydospora]|uniref:Putative phosphoglucomutase n=1 Tax=Phaeomoniella chlamydospora TaxID=158046 RepID=A0A0G2EFG7_PHACM|nr:putative phosphoglucomutase [Phaeomoniella chlamydospora]